MKLFNMKLIKTLLIVLTLIPAITLASETKIATLDVEGAIRASKQLEVLKAELESQYVDQRAKLQSLADQGNALKEKAQKEGDFLSEDERKTLVLEIQQKFQAFQRLKAQLTKQMKEQEQVFLRQLRPQVEEILKELVKKHDVDIIVNKRAVVFAQPGMDLTGQVIEELNKQ